jgi:diguanylate cyclase (GGDEF)-like protein
LHAASYHAQKPPVRKFSGLSRGTFLSGCFPIGQAVWKPVSQINPIFIMFQCPQKHIPSALVTQKKFYTKTPSDKNMKTTRTLCFLSALSFCGLGIVLYRLRCIEKLVSTDPQTGLLSGRVFDKDAALLCRTQARFVVLLVDLDDFRKFNRNGYRAGGDRALSIAAQAMQRLIRRSSDLLYRLHMAGDEFLALLSIENGEQAKHQAERFRCALDRVNTPASIGVVYSEPDIEKRPTEARRTPKRLLDVAEQALKRAKQNGKNCCCSMNDSTQEA